MKPFQQWTFLFVIYMLYLLIGGSIFMALERPNEKQKLDELKKDIFDILLRDDHGPPYDMESNISQVQSHEDTFIKANVVAGIIRRISAACDRGTDVNDVILESDSLVPTANSHLKWNFYNAVYFAFSCTTTIGYGHLSPQTDWGKIFTIFFALVGIPINGTLVYGLGDYFGSKLIKLHNRFKKYNGKLAIAFDITFYVIPGITFFLIIPAWLFVLTENWTFLESFYFAFTSLTTIGFGDFVAGIGGEQNSIWLWLDKVIIILWITFGLGYLVMILGFITKGIKSKKLRMAIEKRLDSIHVTKEKLVKEVEYMSSIVNDLYIWQSQQPPYESENYNGDCDCETNEKDRQALLLRNLTRRFSLSMPILSNDEKTEVAAMKTKRTRTKSESAVFEANNKEKFPEGPDKLLLSVVKALSRKISTHVLTAVESLNEYEAEVLAQKAKVPRSRRKNGTNTLNVPDLPELNYLENKNEYTSFASLTSNSNLEQVVVHSNTNEKEDVITGSGDTSYKDSHIIGDTSTKTSRYENGLHNGDFEASSRNEPVFYRPRTDYLNSNSSYCQKCGDVHRTPHGDQVDGTHHRDATRDQHLPIRSPRNSALGRNRISRSEPRNPQRRRKITAEQSSLEQFLKVLDNVHEKLNVVDNVIRETPLEQTHTSNFPQREPRRRKIGVVSPEYSYFSHTFGKNVKP